MKALIFFLILFLFQNTSSNGQSGILPTYQENIFNWWFEYCEYSAEFDTTKYSKKQLEGTFHLCYFYGLSSGPGVFEIEDIKKLSLDKLDTEYKEKRKYFEDLEIVNLKYFENLKESRLQYLYESYKLYKIRIEAYSNPSVLLNANYGDKCFEYAKVMNETDSCKILAAWKELFEKQIANNADPQKRKEEFLLKYNSKQKLLHARIYLLGFGWLRNATIKNNFHSYKNVHEKFNDLFTKIIYKNCDESL